MAREDEAKAISWRETVETGGMLATILLLSGALCSVTLAIFIPLDMGKVAGCTDTHFKQDCDWINTFAPRDPGDEFTLCTPETSSRAFCTTDGSTVRVNAVDTCPAGNSLGFAGCYCPEHYSSHITQMKRCLEHAHRLRVCVPYQDCGDGIDLSTYHSPEVSTAVCGQ